MKTNYYIGAYRLNCFQACQSSLSMPIMFIMTMLRNNTDNLSKGVPDRSMPAINSRRENTVFQSKSSGARDPEQQAGEVSGARENDRRK